MHLHFPRFLMFQVIRSLDPDPEKQEALVVENIPDPLAGEQVDNEISSLLLPFVNYNI